MLSLHIQANADEWSFNSGSIMLVVFTLILDAGLRSEKESNTTQRLTVKILSPGKS